jgi:NAD+ kinase
MHPKTIGVIAHAQKPGVAELTGAVLQELSRRAMSILVEKQTATLVGQRSDFTIAQLGARSDLLLVLGGDGTILNVVGHLDGSIKPIFGINVGSLGFLTCSNSSAYREAIESIATGRIAFSERTLLDVRISAGAPSEKRIVALNDAVFSRGELSRLVRLRARVDGETLTEFNADGLIIATPTGSTAYSLSAGGPIMAPESGVFVITPICPHVLTNRSVIVAETSLIEVEASEQDYPVYLTVDGREPLRLETGAIVRMTRSDKPLPLAVLPEMSFFSVVRQKLKWSGTNI